MFTAVVLLDVDVNEKYERRRGASLPASSIIKDYNTISKQFLINFTATSSSLNFGTIIINNFLIRPEFIQSGFKCVSRFCMHSVIRQERLTEFSHSTEPVSNDAEM